MAVDAMQFTYYNILGLNPESGLDAMQLKYYNIQGLNPESGLVVIFNHQRVISFRI